MKRLETVGELPKQIDLDILLEYLTEGKRPLRPELPFSSTISLLTGGKFYEISYHNPDEELRVRQTGELPKEWFNEADDVWRIPVSTGSQR